MRRASLLLPLLIMLGGAPAAFADDRRIDLYTMGPGDDVFSRFGHAALCVSWGPDEEHAGICYNYGTGDFDTPETLIREFLRGRARFWQSSGSVQRLFDFYGRADRTIYRQRLPLDDAQVAAVADKLDWDHRPENRYYIYHHFADNCTTRVRDVIDTAVGGALSRGADVPNTRSYRQMVRAGLSASTLLLTLSEVLISREIDRYPTVQEAMFHPDVLREQVAAKLGVPAEVVYARHRPVIVRSPHGGQWILIAMAIALAGLVVAADLTGRRWPRRVALVATGLVLGFFGLMVYVLALSSIFPEFTHNEMMAVVIPTDLALGFLPARVLRRYLQARLAILAVIALGALVGIFIQPVLAPLVFVGLPLAAAGRALFHAVRVDAGLSPG